MYRNENNYIIQADLDDVKSKILRNFVNSLPAKPYYSDSLRQGLRIASLEKALKHKYIQYNDFAFYRFLVFDIDRDGGALSFENADLPAPNLAIINPSNTHAHLIYQLENPVCRTETAHLKPINFLKSIYQAYALKLKADMAFAGLITKNPLSLAWHTWEINDRLYSLSELADYVELQKIFVKKAESADFVGRNDNLFNTVRTWAYQARYNYENYTDFRDAVFFHTTNLNRLFETPLKISEIKSISKSISKFVWSHFTEQSRENLIQRTHTSELQRERGIKSGIVRYRKNEDKRIYAAALRAQGKTYREIAKELGVSHITIRNWLK